MGGPIFDDDDYYRRMDSLYIQVDMDLFLDKLVGFHLVCSSGIEVLTFISTTTFVSTVTDVLNFELLTSFFFKNASIVFRLLIILLTLKI